MTIKKQNPYPKSPIFILGSQRSGTTWLSNIFDASPETIFFWEPFAPPTGIFPEMPGTNEYLEESTNALDALLRDEMPRRLMRHKSLLSKQSIINPEWFKLERWIAGKMRRRQRIIPKVIRQQVNRFLAINYNRMEDSYTIYPKKVKPSVWVMKELRLAGKLPVFKSAFPSAQYVVIIRHPCATVHSILKLFERNKLFELRGNLVNYLDDIDCQSISDSYRNEIRLCRSGNLAHLVALYWRISYETMFKQLHETPKAHFIVYEQLASDPQTTVLGLFTLLGIPWSDSVTEYISYSSSTEIKSNSPVMTLRNSREYFQVWKKNISRDTHRSVLDIVEPSFLMAQFIPYY